MLTIKNMDGYLQTSDESENAFSYSSERNELVIRGLTPTAAMDLLNTIDARACSTEPRAIATVSTSTKVPDLVGTVKPPRVAIAKPAPLEEAPAEVQAKVAAHEAAIAVEDAPAKEAAPAKEDKPAKRTRKPRKAKTEEPDPKSRADAMYAASAERVAAQDAAEEAEPPARLGGNAARPIDVTADIDAPAPPMDVARPRGSVAAPIAVVPEDDEDDAPEPEIVAEVVSLADDNDDDDDFEPQHNADATQDKPDAEDPVPDGWARDAKGQLFCESCGNIECVCADDDIESPEPAPQSTPASNPVAAASTPGDDPLLDLCMKESRLLPLMDVLISNGVQDEDQIYEKCVEWRALVPALTRLKESDFDSRIRRAIGSTVP